MFGKFIILGAPPPGVESALFKSLASDVLERALIPIDLRDQLLELEEWANLNRKDAKRSAIAFWALKIPAIITASTAGIWAFYDLTTITVISGAVSGACVIIDGIYPRGMLRNTYLKAYHDIRILTSRMLSEWRSRKSNAKDENVARQIIRNAEPERQRIAAYVRDAETALNVENET